MRLGIGMRPASWIAFAILGLSAVGVTAPSATRRAVPSDEALRIRFFDHRADFESLVTMANEDSHLTRIAPDFTWLDNDAGWPRENVGITGQRWSDYKQLFLRVGTAVGICRGTDPTRIIIPIAAFGLVPTGFEKGIVYSEEPLSPIMKTLDQRPPDKFWDGPDRSHVLVYKPIENHWYIFYEEW
jgi:hypothetical protein